MDQENFVSKNGANLLVYPGKFIVILTYIAFRHSLGGSKKPMWLDFKQFLKNQDFFQNF